MHTDFLLEFEQTQNWLDILFKVNWYKLFVPSTSLAEVLIRGSLVYLMLFTIMRFLPNRHIGAVGIADILVVVLFVNAAQNALASNYTSLTEGFVLVSTIIFWSYIVNWLGYKFPRLGRFLNPPPKALVRNGRIVRESMEQELLTQEELMSLLRKQGVQKLDEVKVAFMESDGTISVMKRSPKSRKALADEPR